MKSVSNKEDVERESQRVIKALYGDVTNFTVTEIFPLPEKGPRTGWDVQVRFIQNNIKYTVDLEFEEKSGQLTYARLLDTMTPL